MLGECAQMWLNLGLIQKGTCAPFCWSVHSLGWGVGRVRGAWRAPTFPSSWCVGPSHPHTPACPATGFPCCDWLLSLVLAEVCLAAQGLTPHSYRETNCTALTINTPQQLCQLIASLRIPFPDPVSSLGQPKYSQLCP